MFTFSNHVSLSSKFCIISCNISSLRIWNELYPMDLESFYLNEVFHLMVIMIDILFVMSSTTLVLFDNF